MNADDPSPSSKSTTGRSTESKPAKLDEKEKHSDTSSPFRPANILRYAVTNSTRLIGWNDDDFRKLLEEHRKKRKEDPSIPNIEEEGFGLMSTLQDAARDGIRDYIHKKSGSDDLKDLLRQIEDNSKLKKSEVENQNPSPGKAKDSSSLSSSWFDMNIFEYINIRDFKLYQNILSNVKYQRDAYIMGTDHANLRIKQREEEAAKKKQEQAAKEADPYLSEIDIDIERQSDLPKTYHDYLALHPVVNYTSLGNQQLNGILTWFVPSRTMYDSLLPNVLYTIGPPSRLQPEGGPLRHRINRSVCDLIPMSQDLLNDVVKSNMAWVLTDSSWRETVKGSSRNYFTANQHSELNTSSRVVTTKTVRS